jgi:N6-adenine-specific methylase
VKYLKPTKSYIREVLFNIIDIHNCETSLDLFAGSGILSMEAYPEV